MRRSARHGLPFFRHAPWFSCLLLGLLHSLPASAQPTAASVTRPASTTSADTRPVEAREWLQRIRQAANQRSYQGTLVITGSGEVSSSRVSHIVEGSRRTERIDALAGEAYSWMRQDGVTRVVWPHKQLVVEAPHDRQVLFPGLPEEADERLLAWYDLRPVGTDRIAGHDAVMLSVQPRDAWRFGFRLWVERQSHLLLRIDTLNAAGQALESTAFSDLTLDVRAPRNTADAKAWRHYRVIRPAHQDTQLTREGWALRELPPGFREVSCNRRPLTPWGAGTAPAVLQVMFSDGLAHISLFIDPVNGHAQQPERPQPLGATHVVREQVDRHWVTAVGDVPPDTLRRFVTALERKQ